MKNEIRGHRLVVKPNNSVEVEDFSVNLPSSGQVLIQTEYTLISAGTELGSQELNRTHDLYPGYSNVGRIIAIGDGVKSFHEGERVLSLGNHASHVITGTLPQQLQPVPENARPEEATFGVLGSVSMHGIRKARIELGEHAAITGMGLVGQLALQLASHTGCETLTAIDPIEQRLEIAKENSATHGLNPTGGNLAEEIRKITNGRGLDVIVEASGYPQILPMVFELARIGGRIMLLGSIWHRKIEVDFMEFHLKELTLTGCHQPKCPTTETPYFPWTQQYNRRQILHLIATGRLNVRPLISHILSYRSAAEAYRLLRDEKDKALGVVLDWTE